MAIKLGSRVRDIYTKIEGLAVSRTEWLYGCTRIGIERTELDKDGKPFEVQHFDEQRVETVKEETPVTSADSDVTTGGPKDAPRRYADPVR